MQTEKKKKKNNRMLYYSQRLSMPPQMPMPCMPLLPHYLTHHQHNHTRLINHAHESNRQTVTHPWNPNPFWKRNPFAKIQDTDTVSTKESK